MKCRSITRLAHSELSTSRARHVARSTIVLTGMKLEEVAAVTMSTRGSGGVQPHGPGRFNLGQFFHMPSTEPGRWPLGLMLTSFAFMVAFFGFVAAGEKGGDTFFSGSPWLPGMIIPAFVAGIAGGVSAAWAVLRQGERSLIVLIALTWGALQLVFAIGELAFPH